MTLAGVNLRAIQTRTIRIRRPQLFVNVRKKAAMFLLRMRLNLSGISCALPRGDIMRVLFLRQNLIVRRLGAEEAAIRMGK